MGMKLWHVVVLCVAVVGLALVFNIAIADDYTRSALSSSGKVGCELAKNLYGDTQALLQGNLGLLLGLIMLLAGFWALINGAAILPAMATIILGGLVTALPSLLNVAFEGLGGLMSDMGGMAYETDVACEAVVSKRCGRTATGVKCDDVYTYNGEIHEIIQ